jgi:hypothetical protein
MTYQAVRRVLGAILILFSLVLLGWGVRPIITSTQSTDLFYGELFPASAFQDGDPPASDASISEKQSQAAGEITLEWPSYLRMGDAGEIRLRFEPVKSGGLPVTGDWPAYSRILSARLDLPGIRHTPSGKISQALSQENPVVFLWNLRADLSGRFPGDTWLSIHFSDLESENEPNRVLFNQQVIVPVKCILGMNGMQARLAGGAGFLLGAFIVLAGNRPEHRQTNNRPVEG